MTDQNEKKTQEQTDLFLNVGPTELTGQKKIVEAINKLHDMLVTVSDEARATADFTVEVAGRVEKLERSSPEDLWETGLEDKPAPATIDEVRLNTERKSAYDAGVVQGFLNAQKRVGNLISTVRVVADIIDKESKGGYHHQINALRDALAPFENK